MASPTAKKTKQRKWGWLKVGAMSLLGLMLVGGLGAAFVWNYLFSGMPPLPEVEELWTTKRDQAYEFRDRNGELIIVRGPHYGRVVDVADLPAYIPNAFIAAEDKRFYEHDGADTTAILRAAWSNWRSGRTVSGASTITQQVIKNFVLDNTQSYRRKAQEVRLAQQLETQLSKDEIITLYLNRIYFGSSAYGISAAAEEYFGKSPQDITLSEAALLATLPKAPSRLALDNNLEGARTRQRYVLDEMLAEDLITIAQREAAIAEPVSLAQAASRASGAGFGHILDAATERLAQIAPDAPGDLVITLSIDRELQTIVTNTVVERVKTDGPELNATEAAAILLEPDGAISALVGGVDYATSQYNRATQAKRQPGSSFKAFVFAAALQAGIDPFAVYEDKPVTFGTWEPKNYSPGFYGPVTVSEALAKSLNTVAAQIGHEVGEERVIALAKSFGIKSPLRPLPSIALGSQEVTLQELTAAFGAFAKSGFRLDPYLILKVEDSRGQVIYEREEKDPIPIFSAALAKEMNAMLARVVLNGTGGRAAIPDWTVAGKTGTSQSWRDALFVGFTSQIVAGVWVGNDDDSPMKRVTGGGLPAEIWSDIVKIALADRTPTPLAGTEKLIVLSDVAKERIGFYRNLSGAFGEVADRTFGVHDASSQVVAQP